jgi:hypothetical protein
MVKFSTKDDTGYQKLLYAIEMSLPKPEDGLAPPQQRM